MEKFVVGDIVGQKVNGVYFYYTVKRIEKGKLICTYAGGEYGEFEFEISPSDVKRFPVVTVSAEKVRAFMRYEGSYKEIFGNVRPSFRLRCDEKPVMTGEDLLAAFRRYKEKGYETANKEWAEPAGELCGRLFFFPEDSFSSDPVQGYRFIPHDGRLFYDLFAQAALEWRRETEKPDIDALTAQLEKTIEMLSLPVCRRDYGDEIKADYIEPFQKDEVLESATDDELALYVQWVEELCKKDNKTAMYAKAYSLYGGNRAYECDWVGSRDLLLKLMETEEDPFLANTLGYIFYYGRCTGEPEYEKAFYYYNIGAAGGIYESRYKLSDMYRHGYGVKKNLRIASGIINELYNENLKYILEGHTDCKFADVALRMGSLYKEGIGREPDPDEAYEYYLQADFAIKQRLRDCNWYGDGSVAAGIGNAIAEILPETAFAKPRRKLYYSSLQYILSSAFELHRRVEAKIQRLKNGQYSLTFRILPNEGEKYPPRFFVTEPGAHFCGYKDRLIFKTKNVYKFFIDGKAFEGDRATVVCDDVSGNCFFLYGKCVAELYASLFTVFPSAEKGKARIFVSVTFSDGGRHYDYLCDIPGVKVGDEVIVPTNEGAARVRVVKVFEKTEAETTLPISKYKSVIKKA